MKIQKHAQLFLSYYDFENRMPGNSPIFNYWGITITCSLN